MTNERLIAPVSETELVRRWSAVRSIMDQLDLDALVLQNSNDWLGGYVRWFTGVPANNAYPRTVIFPRVGGMTIVEQGPFGGRLQPSGDDVANRGVEEILSTPSYASAAFTGEYDAVLALDALSRHRARRVGWVAPASAYFSFGKALEAKGDGIQFIDATDEIDNLKAIKSGEEWLQIEQTARLQDEVIAEVRKFIRAGLHDFEVAAYAQYVAQTLGSEQGIFISSSSPSTKAAVFRARHLQGRKIESGDVFALLVETNGPGGFYTEIARTFVLGTQTAALKKAVADAIAAQAHTLEQLRPGTPAATVLERHNAYMRGRGFPEEARLYSHGQGYDMVERPLIRDDETMAIEADMNIVVHPGYVTDEANALVCDNYRICRNGPGKSLHTTPQEVLEVA